MLPETVDCLEELIDAAAGVRLRPEDGRPPLALAERLQREQRFDRGRSPVGALAVGLVDDEDVRDLHDAGLERLHLVSRARHEGHDRHVGRAHDVHLVLADSHRFDQHDILAGGIEHQRRIAGCARQSAQVATRRHAADEHVRVPRVGLHPDPVAENRPAAVRAGGVDRDHPHGGPPAPIQGGQPIHERALAGAGRPRHAHQMRAPGVREQVPQQGRPAGVLVLDEANRPRDGPDIAGADAIGEGAVAHARSWRAMTRRWISLVPSPIVVSFTSRKNFSAG